MGSSELTPAWYILILSHARESECLVNKVCFMKKLLGETVAVFVLGAANGVKGFLSYTYKHVHSRK